MTFSAGDFHDICIYAGRFRTSFPIFDADGDPISSAAGLDSERSIDCGAFSDCTNEATEVAASAGSLYYLDLTATETTGSNVTVIIKSSTVGAKSTFLSIPIVRLPILESGTAQAGAASTITLASTASAKDNFYAGLYIQNSNNSPANVQGQTRKIISYVGSTKVATVEAAWGTNPSSATTYDILIPLTVNVGAIAAQRMPDWGTAGVPKVDVVSLAANTVTAAVVASDAIIAFRSIASGTSDSGTTTTMVDSARTEGDTDYWKGDYIVFTSGNIAGQARLITSFNATTDTITFVPATTQAVATQTYEIWPTGRVDTAMINGIANSSSLAQMGVNIVNIAGSAVSTSTAQLGVNVVSTSTDAITSSSLAAGCITSSEAPNLDVAVSSRLAPTVAARTLDVSSTGEAGVDWANVGSPTTTLALTGTTVGSGVGASATDVTNARDAVLAKLPTALVSGRIDASVGAMATDTLTNTALATSAVTEITSAIAGGSATPTNVTDARDAILAKLPSALVSGRIDASIGAAAANTLTASALATDAVTEIVAAIYAVAGADPVTMPAATATAFTKIDALFAEFINKKSMNRSTGVVNLYANADPQTTVIGTCTVTDDGTVETRPKMT